ncbi:MAG: hypothetical protein AAGH73_10105 [Pseudomonadota bacterium]
MLLRAGLFLLPALLSACVATAPITQAPIQMRFTNDIREASVTGIDTVIVRNRLRTGDTRAELSAVPCQLTGPGYAAQFTTPAAVQLPLFRNTAPQLALSCTYQGETQTRTLTAANISERERREARRRALEDPEEDGVSGTRILLSLNFDRRREGRFDVFRYPDATFTFRR